MGEGTKRTKAKAYQTSLTAEGNGEGFGADFEQNLLTELPAEEQVELDCHLSSNASPPPVGSTVILLDRNKKHIEVYLSVAKIGDVTDAGSAYLRDNFDFDQLASKNIRAKVTQVSPEWATFSVLLSAY